MRANDSGSSFPPASIRHRFAWVCTRALGPVDSRLGLGDLLGSANDTREFGNRSLWTKKMGSSGEFKTGSIDWLSKTAAIFDA